MCTFNFKLLGPICVGFDATNILPYSGILFALQLTCGICFENYPREMMSAAACSHPFCATCWRGLFIVFPLVPLKHEHAIVLLGLENYAILLFLMNLFSFM